VVILTTSAGVHKKDEFSFSEMINGLKNQTDFRKAGAIALFIGVVREETSRNEKVQKLTLEAYEERADEMLTQICLDLKKKDGIVDVQIHHLLGEFNVGEDLVYVLVAGSHRQDVFPVLEEAVERYKKEAPIFKKEQIVSREGKIAEYWEAERGETL
jgi:molybdopterin synthase catalytic subunit